MKELFIHMNESPWGSKKSWSSNGPSKGPNIEELFKGGGPSFPFRNRVLYSVIIVLCAALWLGSGLYQINPDEEGLVLRFGALNRVTGPGWHYHLPFPVERIWKQKVTTTNQITIGFGNPDESLMLTGDRNIVDASIIVQWHIKDAEAFLFNIRDPQHTVKAATESAIREIIGQTPIDETFAEGRAEIQEKARTLVQNILDSYGAGIQITEVNLKDVNPPPPVIESFREVDRAYADQERMFNEAQAYYNDVVPRARGEAAKLTEQGIADKASAIAGADGEVARFNAFREEKKSDSTLEDRLYLETMENILKDARKVVVSSHTGAFLPHMAIGALTQDKTGSMAKEGNHA